MRSSKPKALAAGPLFDYAVRALSARALTQSELRDRLLARAENRADVPTTIARLKQYGYLDDRRFAETYSRLRRENKGYGKFRVLRELRGRRVAPALAEKTVADAFRDADETVLIEQFLRRKLRYSGAPPALDDRRRLASLQSMLLRAGFSSGKIWTVLRQLSARPEWIEDLESAAEEEVSE